MGLAVGDIMLMQVRGTVNGQQTITNFTYRVSGMTTINSVVGDLDNYLAALDNDPTSIYAGLLACLPLNWGCDFLVAQQISPIRSVARKIVPMNTGGGRTHCNFQQSNGVITRETDLAGRSQISTLHVPGIADLDAVDGETTVGYAPLLNTLADRSILSVGYVGVPTLTPVIYHKGKVPNFNAITIAFSQPTVRTMRRRVVGRGI